MTLHPMTPARVTIESEPDLSLLRTIEIEADSDTVYLFDRTEEIGRPDDLRVIAFPGEHAEAVARAIMQAMRR